MPLEIRRRKLGLKYLMKLKGQTGKLPTKNLLNQHWEFGGTTRVVKTNFIETIKSVAGEIGILNLNVCPPVCWSEVPLWLIPDPNVDLYFLKTSKRMMSEVVVEEIKSQQCQIWGDHLQIYTDGSKDPESGKVAFGTSIPKLGYKKGYRIPDYFSVFTAELMAVLWAVRWVEDNKREYSVICSDSAATLNTIKNMKTKARPDLLVEILQVLYRIHKAGNEVGFLWVPAHMGVEGNEEADEVAKKAVQEERVQLDLQHGLPDYTEIINRSVKEMWQRSWDCERNGRAYYSVQKMVEKTDVIIDVREEMQ